MPEAVTVSGADAAVSAPSPWSGRRRGPASAGTPSSAPPPSPRTRARAWPIHSSPS